MSIRSAELNNLKVNKGSLDGKRFPIWDSVAICPGEGETEDLDNYVAPCPVVEECLYDKTGKCRLQTTFLRQMMNIAIENLPEKKKDDEYILQLIGLNLLPLYKQLCIFKINEHALGLNVYIDTKINPIYREIRMVLKDIDDVWVRMGVSVVLDSSGRKMKELDPMEHGLPGYYDEFVMPPNTKPPKEEVPSGVAEYNKLNKTKMKKKTWQDGL